MKNTALIIIILTTLTSCKTNDTKLVVFEEKAEVSISVNSACRSSVVLPLENEAGLKGNIQSYAAGSIKKLKFKTSAKAEKSNTRISKIEFVITETCAEKSDKNPPPVKLHEKITLENTATKQVYLFEVDTLINNQSLNPNRLAVTKLDYQSYIQPLTERNFKKVKDFFSKKK